MLKLNRLTWEFINTLVLYLGIIISFANIDLTQILCLANNKSSNLNLSQSNIVIKVVKDKDLRMTSQTLLFLNSLLWYRSWNLKSTIWNEIFFSLLILVFIFTFFLWSRSCMYKSEHWIVCVNLRLIEYFVGSVIRCWIGLVYTKILCTYLKLREYGLKNVSQWRGE